MVMEYYALKQFTRLMHTININNKVGLLVGVSFWIVGAR